MDKLGPELCTVREEKSEIQQEASALRSLVDNLHNQIAMLEDALSAVVHPYPVGKLVNDNVSPRGSSLGSALFGCNENLNNAIDRLASLRNSLAV